MIENIKRQKNGLGLCVGFILGVWWMAGFHLDLPEFSILYKAVYGSILVLLLFAAVVALDWYRSPAYAVDGPDEPGPGE